MSSNPDYTRQHNSFGNFKVTVSKSGLTSSATVAVSDREILYMIHGIIMFICWCIFGLVMTCTNRWCAHTSDYIQYLHSLSGFMVTGVTVGDIIYHFVTQGFEVNSIHSVPGFIVMIGCFLLTLNGLFTYWTKTNKLWNTKQIFLLRKIHRWGSAVLLILSVFVCFVGILEYTEDSPVL